MRAFFVCALTACLIADAVAADESNVRDYLRKLASAISAPQPVEAAAWKASAQTRRRQLLHVVGLDPLPEKTPLNAQYVGDPVELERCVFRRVVFESRPGLYVGAHLYIPKGVSFPAPAVVYVPGHSRRDKYLPHPLAYASKGYVAIGLPMVGEEGRIEEAFGKCGHYGPYYDHFDWYATGYSTVGPEVWDTVRAIDFLLTTQAPGGNGPAVDQNRIGMAGLSGGSARTFWSTAVDTRISAAVACQGFTTVDRYDATVKSTCDVHLFYNFYHQSYAELYGNAAPRALRVIQATEDSLYNNPQPVAAAMKQLYAAVGKSDRFSYVTFPGGHGYTPNVVKAEEAWLDQWLKPETPKLPTPTAEDRARFAANRKLLDNRANLQCFSGSREDGWKLNGKPLKAGSVIDTFTGPAPTWTAASFQARRTALVTALRDDVLRHAYAARTAKLVFAGNSATLVIDDTLNHKCVLVTPQQKASKTVIQLVNDAPQNHLAAARQLSKTGANVLVVQVSALNDKHLRRFAALVGHTTTSLAINDALAAVAAVRAQFANPAAIYVRGKGSLAVAALYAAVVDTRISGVILEQCPDHHDGDTALMGVLRYADIPAAAGLIAPRPLVLTGSATKGFALTKDIYRRASAADAFIVAERFGPDILEALP